MSQQIGQLISQMSLMTFVMMVAIVAVAFVAAIHFILTQITGSSAKIENVIGHYNRALVSWCAFALKEELQNAYPVGIEIDAVKAPFGIVVKEVVVVVKTGYIETRYKLVRVGNQFVHFEKMGQEE